MILNPPLRLIKPPVCVGLWITIIANNQCSFHSFTHLLNNVVTVKEVSSVLAKIPKLKHR